MSDLRIVSFLPSGTELACALGLADQLVGISHECDFPPNICGKPVVIHSAFALEGMSLGEIDLAVSQRLRSGASLYEVDERLLRGLSPTHILTQNLCQVCAPAGNEVSRTLKALPTRPEVLWMSPHSIEDIHNDLRQLARSTGRLREAERLIANDHARLQAAAKCVSLTFHRPRVFCAEWIDPVYCCGHWVPEMVEIAGGIDVLGRKWADSVRVKWDDIAKASPEVLIIMPCGFDLDGSVTQAEQLLKHPACATLPAVQAGRVYAVDAAYFSRPSLRVVDGTELLAHILHPELCPWTARNDAFRLIPSARPDPQPPELKKVCRVCGMTFFCGAESSDFQCWCAKLPPLSPLSVTNHGCLCPSCLATAIQTSLPSKSPGVTKDAKQNTGSPSAGFTLIELIVVVAIVGLIAGLILPTLTRAKTSAHRLKCVSNLHQLGLAAQMYWDDYSGQCFRYRGPSSNNGTVYWFGWIENGVEGHRTFDATQGALYPYLKGRGVEICPSLNYVSDKFKLKASGVSYGYGYNLSLSSPLTRAARTIGVAANTSETALFGDAAQVNNWQAPASPSNPMIEEWYYLDGGTSQPNGHFRHQQKANVQFCDGHVATEVAVTGSVDQRLPDQFIGRLRTEILQVP